MVRINYKENILSKLTEKFERVNEVLESIGEYMVGSVVSRINKGVAPKNAPLTLSYKKNNMTLRDTGRLMSSICYMVQEYDNSVIVGTNVLYGRIQQLGGVITPKQAQKLAIPASWETRSLMRRYGDRVKTCLTRMKQSGYQIWFTEKAIMGAKGRGKPIVLFIRKNKVILPPRPFLLIDEYDKRVIKKIITKYLES